ncbi:sigma 54-interacting transcriptional regulator [Marinobacterium arenosum]|uniref:sigma 54-interacting transcriptional regulator n=1 Tax=Marinobacterium arenosum TaxID=2862496 RepID=UPI001C965B77|nr:sigma 54-interacting transcriptional regulator [Marinobacterium arenosum]MBY4678502.1 sigma 54-interacting transcriptional regulator [Marinobacterium arenosum]
MSHHILLVDDDPALLKLLGLRLSASGYRVTTANSGAEALRLLDESVNLVLTDLRMEEMDGLALFQAIQQQHPQLPVVIMTAHGSIPDAVSATQQGVFGFLTKPIDRDQLMETLERALAGSGPAAADSWREEIIGRSPALEQLLQQAQRVAGSDVSVLISGPSGSGKELLARAIHRASPRAEKPFIAINCGALPEQLLESELFGHAKGAFTGAVNRHQGLFQAADGGTLFLDEIGDMPLALQVKLLRALQERVIRPVGSTESVSVNVRVLSATHRDLEQAMQSGEFREDLFYRLNVVNLSLPSLQERPEDIALLARHFLARAAKRHNPSVKGISAGALQLMSQSSWPGNVRQLENVIEQLTALSSTPIISEGAVAQALTSQQPVIPNFNDARADFERRYLSTVLRITDGNVTQAAKIAGRNRTDFYKLLNKHGLEAAQFKPADQ